MPDAVFYCTYKLKKGASVPDFLLASEKLNNGYISKQKGYISWEQLAEGETWADVIRFETLADLQAFEANSGNAGELAKTFYSFINLNSCKQYDFTSERMYG